MLKLVVTAAATTPAQATADVLVIPIFEGKLTSTLLAPPLARAVANRLRELQFTAGWGAGILLPMPQHARASFIGVVSLGDSTAAVARTAEGLRRAIAKIVLDAERHGLQHLALALTGEVVLLAQAAVEGVLLSRYHFDDYAPELKRAHAAHALRRFTLLVPRAKLAATRRAIRETEHILAGVTLARDLVNQPASVIMPQQLVTVARRIAAASPHLQVRVYNRAQARARGFSAFLAVARGSTEPPYVIHLLYRPPRAARVPRVAIVGKGVTFDSGGLSLKPAQMMESMKSDMAGAATVLGLFATLSQVAPPVEVHGIIAACENMPSGTAYRPGDILTAKNGKTIEVLNTDAEGRITLADALAYAVEQQPDAIIDVATLTGACLVALGETVAGLWSNNDGLQQRLQQAAEASGEALCPLPLPDEYRPFIQSRVADVRNIATSPYGGAITAALFLREFVNDTPWAHLDIAGPSYVQRHCLPYYSPGGTGYGVRLLAEYLRALPGSEQTTRLRAAGTPARRRRRTGK